MLRPQQLVTLKAYLDANAGTYGALDDQTAAETLNALSVNRVRASMSGQEVFANIVPTEFNALVDANQKAQVLALCSIDSMDPANGEMAADLLIDIFGGGSATITALNAARQENVSPATEQGLPRVRAADVIAARALP